MSFDTTAVNLDLLYVQHEGKRALAKVFRVKAVRQNVSSHNCEIFLDLFHDYSFMNTFFTSAIPITSRLNRICMLFSSLPSTITPMFTSRHANQQEINQGKDHLQNQSSL